MNPSPQPSARWAPHKLAREAVSAPTAPPDAHADRAVYGLMQPLLGLRVLFTDGDLMRAALLPVGTLAAVCAVVGIVTPDEHTPRAMLQRFYETFALLAPLPSLLFARHYERMAVLARHKLGFPHALPAHEGLWRNAKRTLRQMLLVAIGLLPLTLALHLVPFLGPIIGKAAAAVWALHWIVVDAFDSARTLAPGQTIADLDAISAAAPPPWFSRWLDEVGRRTPVVGRVLCRFAALCNRLSRPFKEEIALVETHPSLMIGFALSTAALLATPVLNLLFRPIVLIGAAHVNGRLEQHHDAPAALAPHRAP